MLRLANSGAIGGRADPAQAPSVGRRCRVGPGLIGRNGDDPLERRRSFVQLVLILEGDAESGVGARVTGPVSQNTAIKSFRLRQPPAAFAAAMLRLLIRKDGQN